MSTIKHKETYKLFGIYDDAIGALLTEGDISNQTSDIPWLKCKDTCWELEHYIALHKDKDLQLVTVVAHLEALVKTPK